MQSYIFPTELTSIKHTFPTELLAIFYTFPTELVTICSSSEKWTRKMLTVVGAYLRDAPDVFSVTKFRIFEFVIIRIFA